MIEGRRRAPPRAIEEVVTMTVSDAIALMMLVLAAIRLGIDIRK